jgi:hypothetical protein
VNITIAALCQYQNRPMALLCSDSRQSFLGDYTSPHGDHSVQEEWSAPGVHVFSAGHTPAAKEFIFFLATKIRTSGKAGYQLLDEFRHCSGLYREKLVKRYLVSNWSLSYEEYQKTGAAHLPEVCRKRMADDIGPQRMDFECELLVVLFDDFGQNHLFRMDRRGIVTDHTGDGFCVVGPAQAGATHCFRYRRFHRDWPSEEVLPLVYEATQHAKVGAYTRDETYVQMVEAESSIEISPLGMELIHQKYKEVNESRHSAELGKFYLNLLQDYRKGEGK